MGGKKQYILKVTDLSKEHGDLFVFRSGKIHHFKDGDKIREHLCTLKSGRVDCRCGDSECLHSLSIRAAIESEDRRIVEDTEAAELLKDGFKGVLIVNSWPDSTAVIILSNETFLISNKLLTQYENAD